MKLPGRYKGTRRRREPPIVAECGCGWRRPCNARKAEFLFAGHVSRAHDDNKLAKNVALVAHSVEPEAAPNMKVTA
jgi:hypothetical protein